MKIAVTYDNGNVFQHFGKTEQFKVYEVADGKVVSDQVLPTNGTGHEALADFLKENQIEVVLCGGLGDGMQAALNLVGIAVVSGLEGNADEAVETFLNGALESAGANCQHEEGGCSCGGIAAAAVAAAATAPSWRGKMWIRPAGCTTGAPTMTAPSLMLPMTGESLWNLYAARG